MQIPLSEAIEQLRNELRTAIIEGEGEDIVFTPEGIELNLSVGFNVEAKAGGGIKLLAFLDLSGEAGAARSSQHTIKLSLSVADKDGKPIKVRSGTTPSGLPQ